MNSKKTFEQMLEQCSMGSRLTVPLLFDNTAIQLDLIMHEVEVFENCYQFITLPNMDQPAWFVLEVFTLWIAEDDLLCKTVVSFKISKLIEERVSEIKAFLIAVFHRLEANVDRYKPIDFVFTADIIRQIPPATLNNINRINLNEGNRDSKELSFPVTQCQVPLADKIAHVLVLVNVEITDKTNSADYKYYKCEILPAQFLPDWFTLEVFHIRITAGKEKGITLVCFELLKIEYDGDLAMDFMMEAFEHVMNPDPDQEYKFDLIDESDNGEEFEEIIF